MIKKEQIIIESQFTKIYDIIIPENNLLRKIKQLVDFSFIYEELESKYCDNNGRLAIHPIRMFKYLLLKVIYDLSDVDVVERSRYDMSLKYFLDMAPEENVIEASSLTKFRKLRLKDSDLLDMLINKTVEIAKEKGIIKSKAIIVDATHTKSRYNYKSAIEILRDRSKKLKKAVYKIDENMKQLFPEKNTVETLEKEIEYCEKLVKVIEEKEEISTYPMVKEKLNLLIETINDDLEELQSLADQDARIGHKSADSSFFGYKTHIAMTEERIITAATITTGEKPDGKELGQLLEKSKKAGIEVEEIIGDTAYSEKANIELAKENTIKLISKLNPLITQGNRKKEDEFEFNKDAGMYVCKAGHLAIRKEQKKREGTKNTRDVYFFDVKKCKMCPKREGCYKEGAKTKSYSVTVQNDILKEQIKFQESEYFKNKSKERYKIEAKNAELKNRHGYDIASTPGLRGMQLQGAMSIFAVNLKRILKISED